VSWNAFEVAALVTYYLCWSESWYHACEST